MGRQNVGGSAQLGQTRPVREFCSLYWTDATEQKETLMNKKVKKALDQWFCNFRQTLENADSRAQPQAVIALPSQMIARILSEKRADLLNILKRRPVRSVSELAALTGRPAESVSRDLKLLSKWGFVRYERKGKLKRPVANAEYVIIQLESRVPKIEEYPGTKSLSAR